VTDTTAGIAVAVPFFWPREMRQSAANALRLGQVPLQSLLDDTTAIAVLYGGTKAARYASLNRTYCVVFVDVGATSTEVYGLELRWVQHLDDQRNTTQCLQYGMVWSDWVGSFYFAKRVADAIGVSREKAGKLLKKFPNQYEELLSSELNLLQELLNETIAARNATDEIQVIGGCSWFPFVMKAIRNVSRDIPVKREFNANEAIAMGAVYTALLGRNLAQIPDVYLMRPSFNDRYLVCNSAYPYCRRGMQCVNEIIERTGTCQYVIFTAPGGVPEGVSPIVASFYLTGWENETWTNESYIKFAISVDETFLTGAELCNATNCTRLDVHGLSIDDPHIAGKMAWMNAIMTAKIEGEKNKEFLVKIGDLIDRINAVVAQDDVKIETVGEAERQKFGEIAKMFDDGELRKLTSQRLNETLVDLTAIAAGLGIAIE
jgi:hypothetical protein